MELLDPERPGRTIKCGQTDPNLHKITRRIFIYSFKRASHQAGINTYINTSLADDVLYVKKDVFEIFNQIKVKQICGLQTFINYH